MTDEAPEPSWLALGDAIQKLSGPAFSRHSPETQHALGVVLKAAEAHRATLNPYKVADVQGVIQKCSAVYPGSPDSWLSHCFVVELIRLAEAIRERLPEHLEAHLGHDAEKVAELVDLCSAVSALYARWIEEKA